MQTPSKPVLSRERIHEIVWELTAKHTGKDRGQIQPTDRLIHDLGLDSLGVVELSMELEEQLGITLPEAVLENQEATLAQVEKALGDNLANSN
jgi:acyl carrier protein